MNQELQQRLARLAACAWRIRRRALQMGEVQGQGYIGQALGWAGCAGRGLWRRAAAAAR